MCGWRTTCVYLAAVTRGVNPVLSARLISAPLCNKEATAPTSLIRTARWIGASPSRFNVFTFTLAAKFSSEKWIRLFMDGLYTSTSGTRMRVPSTSPGLKLISSTESLPNQGSTLFRDALLRWVPPDLNLAVSIDKIYITFYFMISAFYRNRVRMTMGCCHGCFNKS